MTTQAIVAMPARAPMEPWRTYWALTKPDINFLIAIATFAGFYLGYPGRLDGSSIFLLLHTLLGTVLVAAGMAA